MSAPLSPRVVGLDLSLTRTGIALPSGIARVVRPQTRGCERMVEIRQTVRGLLRNSGFVWHGYSPQIVAIEGFAFGARGRAVFDIGGLGWIVRLSLYESGIPYVEVAPSSLKKYATGRGNADKAAMQMAAQKRLGYTDEKPDDNIVDAMWLRAMALDAYGCPVVDLPAVNREALTKVEWPNLGRAAA